MTDVEELRRRIGDRVVVASISGGKDSAAMSLYLTELGIEHRRVFADTGWEHPATYEYLRGPLARVIGPIDEVRAAELFDGAPPGEGGLVQLVRGKGMFPSRKFRFCTTRLKIAPLTLYMDRLDCDVLNAVGIRAAESKARAAFPEWEECLVHLKPSEGGPIDWSGETWRPLLRWSEEDVIAIHRRHELPPNPLYLLGASRVGCWPCINARKSELRLIADTDPGRIARIRELETETQAAAAHRYERHGETFESLGYALPTFFQAAHPDRPGERRGMWPIDRAVEWSRTARGGRQFELFSSPSDGCARWGMCEPTEDEDS